MGRRVHLVPLLIATLAAVWFVLSSAGSAHAAEPTSPVQPDPIASASADQRQDASLTPDIAAPLSAVTTALDGTLDHTVAQLEQVTQTVQTVVPAVQAALPAVPAPSQGLARTATPDLAATPQLTSSLVAVTGAPATANVVSAVQHALTVPVTSVTHQLTAPVGALTSATSGVVAHVVAPAVAQVPVAAPVVDQLSATLAALATTADQVTSSTSTTATALLAPVSQLLSVLATPSAHGDATSATPSPAAGTPAPGGASGSVLLLGGLPLPFPTSTHAGPASPAALVEASSPALGSAFGSAPSRAVVHGNERAGSAPSFDLGGLLAPGDGVPPAAPAAGHNPPAPAPSGPDGSGHAHVVLGTGVGAAMLPSGEIARAASARIPLSPTYEPGESPD